MATAQRTNRSYDPYRNMSAAYDGSAARVLRGGEVVAPRSRVRSQPQVNELTRPQVETRPAGKVSPFAVVGFAAVLVLAVCILMNYVTLSSLANEVVDLNTQLSQLKNEEATLLARYELAYDLGAIESAVTADGSMSRPQAGQTIYVDLTEPDSVTVYGQEETPGFWDGVDEFIGGILAYFG